MAIDTPLGDFFGLEDIREFERNQTFLFEDRGDAAMMAHRERPYSGQPHTFSGKRGTLELRGLTKRDVCDCIARGFAQSLQAGDKWDFDEHALLQNAMCNVEKMMDIYPNVEGLEAAE